MAEPLSCACGAVKGAATPAAMQVEACHCPVCRKWSGGIYLSVKCAEVSLEKDAPVLVWASSDWAERVSCAKCGSPLIWRLREGEFTTVSLQAFNAPERFALVEEIFIDDKPGNYALAGDQKTATRAEMMARFAEGPSEKS